MFNVTDRGRLIGAMQWSMGNDKTTDQPLSSNQPAQLVAGLRWDDRGGHFGGQLTSNFLAGKRRVNEALAQTGPTAPVLLKTAGYVKMDMTSCWLIGKQTTLNLAIYNLFNRRCYDWSTVSGGEGQRCAVGCL